MNTCTYIWNNFPQINRKTPRINPKKWQKIATDGTEGGRSSSKALRKKPPQDKFIVFDEYKQKRKQHNTQIHTRCLYNKTPQ